MNKKVVIIIIAAVVVIGIAAFVLLSGGEAQDDVDKQPDVAYYIPGEYFVTNVSGSKMLLKTTVSLGFDKKTMDANALKELNSAMRDIINRELRALTEADVNDPAILDNLKQRLLDALRDGMKFDDLLDIKFNDFVAQ